MRQALLALLFVSGVFAQTPPSFEGTWEGAIKAGGAQLRVRVRLSKAADGLNMGTFDSLDQGASFALDHIQITGNRLRFGIEEVHGTYDGTLNSSSSLIQGKWSQGSPLTLELKRVAPGVAPASPPPAAMPFGLPLELEVPMPPTPVAAGGRLHLVYELHITNLSSFNLLVTKLEVLGDQGPLAAFEGETLNGMLARPGPPGSLTDKRSLGPGLRAVVFVWISVDPGATLPARLRHRLTAGENVVEGGQALVSSVKPLVIGPPLRGANWMAGNGPANASIHRRALITLEGRAHIAQRFAIDWVQTGAGDSTHHGDAKVNKNYYAYGAEVLAVADGVVAATKDGIPENVPGLDSRAVPITAQTIGGNHIILDLGPGRFGFYAHLQPGSLRVKTGDPVRKGQVLGLVGNSGNSTEPHLHFHVSDSNSPLGSDGIPYVLDSFEVTGGGTPGVRRSELPVENMHLKFGSAQ